MYNSSSGMAIALIITIMLLLFVAEKEHKPWTMIVNFCKTLTNYRFALIVIMMLAVLLLNKGQLALENKIHTNWDFTQVIHSYEGDFGAFVQKLENVPMTNILSFVYIFVFPALVWVSLIFYKHKKDNVAVKRTFFAFLLNYIIAVPFYLFVPVNETWFANPHVHLLIAKVYPAFNTEYRQFSGLNNDFPSLHTSISWSLAFVAMSLNYKRFSRVMIVCATTVTFSTLYLGIHWLTDVIGGLVLAAIVVKLASKLSVMDLVPKQNLSGVKRRFKVAKEYVLDITMNLFS